MTSNNNHVDWQINKTRVNQRGEHLLQTGTWSDCSFIVGVEPHQEIINGHKLFLAMSSPVFEAMFFGPIAEKNEQPIPILDVQPKAFKALLQYIYTDQIDLNSFDQACELCYCGKKYMLPHLVVECTQYLWSDLNPKNVCRAYEFAKLFEEPNLMDKCLHIICTETQEVLNESSFEDVEISTLITIYSQENLAIDSELDLFNAIVKYTAKHGTTVSVDNCCKQKPLTTESATTAGTDPSETENIQEPEITPRHTENDNSVTIRDVLKHIRFLTMTPQQFADGPALSELLTQSEKFDILMNMSSQMGNTPMPEGFSNSTKQRITFDQSIHTTCNTQNTSTGINPLLNTVFNSQLNRSEMLDNDFADSAVIRREFNVSGNSNVRINETIDCATGRVTATVSSMQQMPFDDWANGGEMNMRNMPKYYCTRPLLQKTECLNRNMFDCAVTFSVDRNICVLGIEVAAQVMKQVGTYSELLYAHLVDSNGSRLTYLHYTARVQYGSSIELMFYRPVYIQRNKDYKVVVVFNKQYGWYPFGTSPSSTMVRGVTFNFNDEARDGLIRSIIFSC